MNASTALKELLCEQWCAEAEVEADDEGLRVSLPLTESDGDATTVWLRKRVGGWHITDLGTTLMRLSYHTDVDLLSEGQRARAVERMLSEQGVTLDTGELHADATEEDLAPTLLRFGVAMSRVGDMKLWTRTRAMESRGLVVRVANGWGIA